MRFLLDTHAVLWLRNDPDRVPGPLREVLADPQHDLVVSSISAWEIATKHRLGRLPGAESFIGSWDEELDRIGARDLVTTSRHAMLAGTLTWEHRDPFDRLLVAQAVLEDAALVTNDRAITAGSTARVIW